MKREDDIFRKLKNEKPLVKTVGDAPARRTPPASTEPPAKAAPPTRRRIGSVPSADEQSAEPAAKRRTIPEEQPAPARRRPPQETPAEAPKRRRIISAEPAEQPAQPAPPRREPPKEAPPRRMNISTIEADSALAAKVGGNSRDFSRPEKVAVDTAERKPLTYRHEEKYYISYADYIVLRQQLRAVMHPDPHADENGEYYIRSLYLDDMYNTAVAEKSAGVQFRHKYRIRIYNFSKTKIRFEKKIKNGQYIAKESFDMTYDEYQAFLRGDIEFLLHKESPLAKEIYLSVRQARLRPIVVVDYEREPFVMDYESIRITFDKNLRSGNPSWDLFHKDLPRTSMLPPGIVVLEVKYNRALPDYLARLINGISAMQTSAISKYIICRQYD